MKCKWFPPPSVGSDPGSFAACPRHANLTLVLQVIVFNFSKKECEALALQMQSLDLNDDAERALVDGIFSNAVRLLT